MSTKKPPTYDTPNQLAAAIILTDPERHLAWPEPLTEAEVEGSLMVRWARRIAENQVPVEELEV